MKRIIRYVLIYLPFVLGIILFLFNVVNLFSSLCLFVGGYVAIKNTFDYRLVKKNMNYGSDKTCYKNNHVKEVSSVVKVRKRDRVRVRKK